MQDGKTASRTMHEDKQHYDLSLVSPMGKGPA